MRNRRHRKIAAAIAYNDTDPDMLLTPATVMFADADVCQRSLVSLEREGPGMKPCYGCAGDVEPGQAKDRSHPRGT
jgi:hypothetical protein